jgi:xanthine dehydrogenase large subunit
MNSIVGKALVHESARDHLTGRAHYTDDVVESAGTLYCAPVLSPHAHARFQSLDATAALAQQDVVAFVSARDIPGHNAIGPIIQDEPLLPTDLVEYRGQVIGIVVARSARAARKAAKLVQAKWEVLPAVLSIDDAMLREQFVLKTREIVRGDPQTALRTARHRLSGKWSLGGQEHFYLEGMVAIAWPQVDGGVRVLSSTQHPTEVQHMVAHALGVSQSRVSVQARRLGGAFGGKESQASHIAAWAALAARKTGKPCKMRLDRDDDMLITGKRHDFQASYEVGFDDQGLLLAVDVSLASRCGFSADLSGPINDRAMFHLDNCYWLPHVRVQSFRCKTNTQSATAFRGFGGPQGMAVIEQILDEIALALRLDPLVVRQRNFYGLTERNSTPYGMTVEDNIAPQLVQKLVDASDYSARRERIAQFNALNHHCKRGIALTPVKFGISFTATHLNQAGALVCVYSDGSVLVNHGGIEMGQGLHTKVLQIVAQTLGVPLKSVSVSTTDTEKIGNTSATAASSGADMNGKAAQAAATEIRTRLSALYAKLHGCDAASVSFDDGRVHGPGGDMAFADLVQQAYMARIQLWSDGFYATPKIHYDMQTMTGRPFFYFAYGAAVSEVAVDLLTGEHRVLRVDVLHDVGESLNPALDRGQIEGGFIQGMGWLTTEELVWSTQGASLGLLTTHAPSTYKIPAVGDVPDIFNVELWPEANREDTVYRSKAVGEPPLMLALSVWHAVKHAVRQANPLADLNAPCTPNEILRSLLMKA